MELNNVQEKKDEQRENKESINIETVLKKNGVQVKNSEDIEGLSSRGYGKQVNGDLLLSFYETLYLISKNIITVKKGRTEENFTFKELLDKYRATNKISWSKYLIYRDLRSRGYVIRNGFGAGIDFRVYERGEYGRETANYLVVGISEGQKVVLEDMARILKYVQSLKKTLIVAVLNRRGEIVYYTISRSTF
jgi:tRNA-intron endonuclease